MLNTSYQRRMKICKPTAMAVHYTVGAEGQLQNGGNT
jgi:hypothetical protein